MKKKNSTERTHPVVEGGALRSEVGLFGYQIRESTTAGRPGQEEKTKQRQQQQQPTAG